MIVPIFFRAYYLLSLEAWVENMFSNTQKQLDKKPRVNTCSKLVLIAQAKNISIDFTLVFIVNFGHI